MVFLPGICVQSYPILSFVRSSSSSSSLCVTFWCKKIAAQIPEGKEFFQIPVRHSPQVLVELDACNAGWENSSRERGKLYSFLSWHIATFYVHLPSLNLISPFNIIRQPFFFPLSFAFFKVGVGGCREFESIYALSRKVISFYLLKTLKLLFHIS